MVELTVASATSSTRSTDDSVSSAYIQEAWRKIKNMTPEERESQDREINQEFPNWEIRTASEYRRDDLKRILKFLICPFHWVSALHTFFQVRKLGMR